jgi:hypothetical protein
MMARGEMRFDSKVFFNFADLLSRLLRIALHEGLEQHRNIFFSVPETRYVDRENVQPGTVLGVVFFAHGAQKMLAWFGGYGFSVTMGFFTGMMHIPVTCYAQEATWCHCPQRFCTGRHCSPAAERIHTNFAMPI